MTQQLNDDDFDEAEVPEVDEDAEPDDIPDDLPEEFEPQSEDPDYLPGHEEDEV